MAAQAQATISQVNVSAVSFAHCHRECTDKTKIQASASVLASQMMSQTQTRFALALTFSIIGSSLISILAYYLLLRYWKRRRLAKQEGMLRGSTRSSDPPSLSEFPHPRKSEWSFVREADPHPIREPHPGTEVKLPDEPPRALFSNPNPVSRPDREDRMGDWEGPGPSLERKNTLIYDAERPEEPPRFKSLLVESLRSVSQFGNRISTDLKAAAEAGKRTSVRRVSRKVFDDEGSEIGTAM